MSVHRSPDDPRAPLMGVLIHAGIAELVRSGRPTWGPGCLRRIEEISTGLLRTRMPGAHRADQVRLMTAMASYVRCLLPPEPWVPGAAEAPLGTGRADVVWRRSDGVLVDEIKSGRLAPRMARTDAQVRRYLEAGIQRWGNGWWGSVWSPPATRRRRGP